jgi:TonB-dependent receptor
MLTRFSFGSLLLISSALISPAALAQGADAASQPPQPAAEQPPVAEEQPADTEAAAEQPDEVEVSIPGADLSSDSGQVVVTGSRTPNVLRRTPQVVSILSQEDIARTGEGDIAGALQRVTGLSVVGNGFVFVRGLGDRYSSALLNGSPLPSPEPLRRVVPLDIFPTSLIASSLVQKTYSANFPGEFGGGVINLTTRTIPEESFLSVGASVGANTETTFQLGYTYYGSDTDWSGFDDGTRDVPAGLREAAAPGTFNSATTPAQRRDFAASLVNAPTTLLQRNRDIPANFSASISGGTSATIFGDGRIGVIASLAYSNGWRTRDTLQQTSLDPDLAGDPFSSFDTVITDNRITVNGLLGIGLEFGEHQIRLTNVYIRDSLKQGRLAAGYNLNVQAQDPALPASLLEQNTYWFERELFNTQLVGEFDFGDLDVDIRLSYANTQRESPYERDFNYIYLGDGNAATRNATDVDDYVNNLSSAGQGARVAFSDLNEDLYAASADLSYTLPSAPVTISAGYAYQDTQRSAERYQFQYFRPDGALPIEIAQQRPDYLVSDFNIYTFNIQLRDISGQEGAAAYDASLRIHAAYAQVQADLFEGLSVNAGVRFEDAVQTVLPSGQNLAATNLENQYFLPALTFTYAFEPSMQIRLHGSRTIARPQFRELAPQIFQDFESDREFTGNPFLQDSELTNLEARYEWYFRRNERFTASAFYKEIQNPIEQAAFFASGQNQFRAGFANAPSAELYGGEVELQTFLPLDGLGGPFFDTRRLLFIANYTYTQSQISAGDQIIIGPNLLPIPAGQLFRDGAPLTGQSDHLVNVQIGLEDTERLSQLTLLATYASERVTNRGPVQGLSRQPDIIERPGLRIDLVARQAVPLFGGEAELQFEARNIFGTDFREFQESGDNIIFTNLYEVGTSFSLGVNFRF